MQLITGDTPISDNLHQVASSSIRCYFSINKRHGTLVLVYSISSNLFMLLIFVFLILVIKGPT